jgi:hypothetical protein
MINLVTAAFATGARFFECAQTKRLRTAYSSKFFQQTPIRNIVALIDADLATAGTNENDRHQRGSGRYARTSFGWAIALRDIEILERGEMPVTTGGRVFNQPHSSPLKI